MARLLALAGVAALAWSAPAAACDPAKVSYSWPVKQLGSAHPVRGTLNEPRGESFHFGIDITAHDGQRVYAVQAGWAYGADGSKVTVNGRNGCWSHRYWHVVPAVADGTRVRRGTLIGHVLKPYGHVHLGEWDVQRGRYIDPLRRRGGLAPYRDATRPVVVRIGIKKSAGELPPDNVRGVVGLVVRTHDLPAIQSPPPWAHFRVAPATIGWRLRTAGGRTVRPFRRVLAGGNHLPDWMFTRVFAPGTRQNVRGGKPAVYRYWLAQSFDTRELRNGTYLLAVRVADSQGNAAWKTLRLTIRNRRA
jgi:Peptidase family M23